MKKVIVILLGILLAGLMTTTVLAENEAPSIILQPQSPRYPEYSTAIYEVKAVGDNLQCTWYMEYQGEIYTISDYTNGWEPWEDYAGETYGATQLDDNTFMFHFGGIESGLNGAEIWCVIEDGHYSVVSSRALITVAGDAMPPTIVGMTYPFDVYQGEYAELRCVATAPGDEQLSWSWYECVNDRLDSIDRELTNGLQYSDFWVCDTSQPGTRFYVCMVVTSGGGIAYSNVVPVTVFEKEEPVAPPMINTSVLPDAYVGEDYKVKLECSDPQASFQIYYNPGGENEFVETGLVLTIGGEISGQALKAGTYTFCVSATGAGGEDYAVYTLKIVDKAETSKEESKQESKEESKQESKEESKQESKEESKQESKEESKQESKEESKQESKEESKQESKEESKQESKEESKQESKQESKEESSVKQQDPAPSEGLAWWWVVVLAVVALGAGIGAGLFISKKK